VISTHDAAGECISPKLHGTRKFGQSKCRLGGQQSSSGPFEQNQAQLRFQFRHMPADGGLARLQLACSGEKTALLKYGQE
jgi:hypothetical protein